MTDRPIFIVGAQRSGTTLVRMMLDAHPAICIGPETSFLTNVADGAARATGTDTARKRRDDYAIGRDGIEAELAEAWARILREHATRMGAARWGDKTPVHRYHGARIKRLFPDAQVVAVVRHPAAVALSRQRWGYEFAATTKDWAASVRRHLADARRFGPRRFRLVRYEDLLADPRGTMGSLLAFLHEPWEETVLDHTSRVEEGAMTDGGTVMSDPLDPSRALAWRDDVDDGQLATITEMAGEELVLTGYAADRGQPVLDLPDNDLTATWNGYEESALQVARRVLRDRGAVELLGRGLGEVRRRGLGSAWRRFREL